MSLEARMVFVNRLKQKLGSVLTTDNVNLTMEQVLDCLSSFDMEQVEIPDIAEDDLLDTYLNALAVQGRSQKTVERYRYAIQRMIKSVSVRTQEITVYHLRNYIAKEKARGVQDGTLEGLRQVFSAYFNWLQREGLIANNPTVNLGAIKKKKKLKTAYSDIDIERLKQKCRNIRDRAIVTFLLASGCRISEVTQLNIEDVDLESLECTVLGKGNKERTVYLDSVAGMTLREYLMSREDNSEALFVGLKQPYERMHPGGIRAMLSKLGDEAHIDKVHPHKFRRTRATNLIKHGMPIQEVAAILGHEKLDTTMEYVVMDKQNIKQAYQKYA